MLTDSTIKIICTVPTVQHLNIACSRITDEGLRCIGESLKSLISLDMYGCQNITVDGIRHVVTLPNIHAINLRGTSIDETAINTLRKSSLFAKIKNLQILTGPLLSDDVY